MNQYLSSAIIIFTWSWNPILTRYGSSLIDIKAYMLLALLFYTFGTIAINLIYDISAWSEMLSKTRSKTLGVAFVDGFFLMAVPFFLYNVLISNSNSLGILVITTWTTAPLLTTLWSYLVYKQTITLVQLMGIITSVLGIITMQIGEHKTCEEKQGLLQSNI